jgi:hypothetical protein
MLLVLLTTWLLVSTMATSVAPSNIIYTFETDPTYSPSEMPDGAQIQMGESDARTALVALYKAANGPSWIRQDCWISSYQLCPKFSHYFFFPPSRLSFFGGTFLQRFFGGVVSTRNKLTRMCIFVFISMQQHLRLAWSVLQR